MTPRLLKWWRAPLWTLALGDRRQELRRQPNPRLGATQPPRAARCSAEACARTRLVATRRLASAVPVEWREAFDRDGFVEIRDFLPPTLSRAPVGAARQRVRHPRAPARRHDHPPRRDRSRASRHGTRAARHARGRRWRPLLAYVGSTRAASRSIMFKRSSPATPTAQPDPQLELHADTFHPSLKAWLFLTDVADDQGPLTYVAGSHRLTPERLAWEQARSVGIRPATICRSAARCELRPTNCLLSICPRRIASPSPPTPSSPSTRRASTPAAAPIGPAVRVEIWAFSRRTPFLPWTGLDLLSWKPLAIRRADWLARIVDRLDRLGLKKQHWLPAGRRRPIDS